jgi:LPS-assembly protein
MTTLPKNANRLNYGAAGEFVNFQQRDRPSGERLDLSAGAHFPLTSLSAYLTPRIDFQYTAYDLKDATSNGTINRALPIFSIDGGLFLERDTHWGKAAALQTLEPRIYYVYIPYRDQSDIPLFDTGSPDFNFAQLFRRNRFNGSDRVGDANQVSLALTTRYLESTTGQQRLSASVGQIFYFSDRRVTLNGTTETAPASDTVAETSILFTSSLSGKADARWNQASGKIDKEAIQLRYAPGARRIFNVSYRFRESEIDQTDVSFIWPMSPRWHLIGRRNYSILDSRPLETLAGFDYESCCWRFQFVKRNYINDTSGNSNNTLYFQLEFKGLSSFGDRVESVLEHGILGY